MKIKNVLILCACTFLLGSALCGCGKDKEQTDTAGVYISDSQEVTTTVNKGEIVSQPSVNTAEFPTDYPEISSKVFNAVSVPKKEKDGETTGSDVLKLVTECGGNVTDELKENIKKEVIEAVNEQVKEVECTDASFDVADNNPEMGLLTVTYKYRSTGGIDSKIYNFPLPKADK